MSSKIRRETGGVRGRARDTCTRTCTCSFGRTDRVLCSQILVPVRCQAECPGVFSDRDSLMAYESMTCKNAVEFVDGSGTHAAIRP